MVRKKNKFRERGIAAHGAVRQRASSAAVITGAAGVRRGSGNAQGWVAGHEGEYGVLGLWQRFKTKKLQKFKTLMIEKLSRHVQFEFPSPMLFVEIFIKSLNVLDQISHLSQTPRFRIGL